MTGSAGVEAQGGLAYGLELAQTSAEDLPIWIVPWAFVPASRLDATSISGACSRLGPVVLRWSEAKHGEFTSAVRRGDKHRRIIRIPSGASESELRDLTLDAKSSRPKAAVGAVLQQAIGVTRGCLIDVEIGDGCVDLELRTASARRLVRIRDGDAEIESLGADPRIPDPPTLASLTSDLLIMVERLPDSPTGWHIEGALVPDDPRFALLQLRPTPGDRPSIPSLTPHDALAQTGLVWGVFDIAVDLDQRLARFSTGAALALQLRETLVDRMESGIVTALMSGMPVLLLNRASGFRLTHESFNLPLAHLRNSFYAAHLPAGTPSHFRLVSNGDTAFFMVG